MRKTLRAPILLLILVATGLVPAALAAQSLVIIPPSQCVWRAGDDPSWAAPNLDESGWQPYPSWTSDANKPHIWLRCHADLSPLHGVAHPAILVSLGAAYQMFVNGKMAGAAGDLRTGNFSMNTVRSFPLPEPILNSSLTTIAFRAVFLDWPGLRFGDARLLNTLRLGDATLLDALRSQTIVSNVRSVLLFVVLYFCIGIVGLLQFGPYYYDRSRRELLWLGLFCFCIALIRLNALCTAALVDYSDTIHNGIYLLGNFGYVFEVLFFFALARHRIPWFIWLLYGLSQTADIILTIQWLLPFEFGSRLNSFSTLVHLTSLYAWAALSFAPAVAFWPWNRIPARMRPLAVCCFLWGAADAVWFTAQAMKIFMNYSPIFYDARAVLTGVAIIVLLGLLFRDQRLATEERALFAGEVLAARNVQQYLIPAHMPPTPGFLIESEYCPSRDVGGDFFQVLPQASDGSVLIVVGDVAGKGIEAGMLATLIVGAVRTAAEFTSDPRRILALLNQRLCGRGFVTCLALRIEQDGSATLVNAGHLPPYLNGKEMSVDGTLPLGAVPGMQFPALRFTLDPGDSLLLMTDGVVEAQNAQGELFGFDRIAVHLGSGAGGAALAAAAQAFGQEDDITVLSLTRLTPVAAFAATNVP